MRIVAKSASVGDLAERLARTQQRPAVAQMGGMIKPARIENSLQVVQRSVRSF